MADIELNNLGEHEEEDQQQAQEETNVDDDEQSDWRNQSLPIFDSSNPDATGNVRGNLDEMKDADRELGRRIGVAKRRHTESKKDILKGMGVNVVKGDGPSSKAILERLKVNYVKGIPNSVEFDNVEIIVREGKKMVYTDDARGASKVNEFKELVEKAKQDHSKTAAAVVKEAIPDVSVSEEHARSVIRSSIENLESFLDEKAEEIESRVREAGRLDNPVYSLTEKEDREARGLIELTLPTALEQEGGITVERKLGFAKIEEIKWRERAERETIPKKKALCESLVKLAEL